MLNHPTLDKLQAMKLTGMATALIEQANTADIEALDFEARLGLLVDREMTYRDSRRLTSRLRRAKLRHNACVEDINFRARRGLDRALITSLATCQWVKEHLNVLITGDTGIGKSWLACALAHQACREGFSALYIRLPRLLSDLAIARGDGRYTKLLTTLAKVDVLVLDDWGMAPLTPEHMRDLLEVLEDRYGARSTVVTSQLPVSKWHGTIADPTFADAILDRLVHNAYKFNLKGESMRKTKAKSTQPDQ
jgi:DNA replication protein DnaC